MNHLRRLAGKQDQRVDGQEGHEVEFDLRNWVDLTSFEIADAKDIYGSLQNIEPLASASARHFIIRAYFGTEDSRC